jgi:hypothetical protein
LQPLVVGVPARVKLSTFLVFPPKGRLPGHWQRKASGHCLGKRPVANAAAPSSNYEEVMILCQPAASVPAVSAYPGYAGLLAITRRAFFGTGIVCCG